MMLRITPPPHLSDDTACRASGMMVVLAAFAMGQAVQINNGVIHPAALAWLGGTIVALLIAIRPAMAARFQQLARIPLDGLLAVCIAVQLIELIYWDLHWNSKSALTVGALIVAAIAPLLARRSIAIATTLLIGAFFIAGVMTIRSMPNPIIDVYWFQQESAGELLQGHDPYGVQYPDLYGKELGFYGPGVSVNGWLTYSYPYPPLTLLFDLPGRLLGDIRYSQLMALCLAAGLLIASAPSRRAVLSAALLLLSPRSLLVIKAAWTEPLVILALAVTIYIATRWPTKLWIALGLLLAMKQYMVLALPLVGLLPQRHKEHREDQHQSSEFSVPSVSQWPSLFKSLALAAAITLPFILWNPTSFIRSVMLWQFRQPFRTDSLSYPALISRTLGGQPGVWLSLLCAGGAIVIARQLKTRGPGTFSLAFGFVMLVFFATSKQAFCNYYFLVIGATCAASALQRDEEPSALRLPLPHDDAIGRMAA